MTRQVLGVARRTLPAAISRRAITISRLSDPMSGLAPFKSCRARFTATITSSKRLELSRKQSSTVIRAIRNDIPSGHSTQETSCSWEPRTKVSPTRVFTNFARPAVYRMLGRKLKKPRSPYEPLVAQFFKIISLPSSLPSIVAVIHFGRQSFVCLRASVSIQSSRLMP